MQEKQPWLFLKHVAVHRGHLDPVGEQRVDDWIDLIAREREVAGDCGSLAACGLEVDALCKAHWAWGRDFHPAFADRIATRHGKGVHPAVVLPLDADDLIELLGVEFDGWRGSSGACRERCFARRE